MGRHVEAYKSIAQLPEDQLRGRTRTSTMPTARRTQHTTSRPDFNSVDSAPPPQEKTTEEKMEELGKCLRNKGLLYYLAQLKKMGKVIKKQYKGKETVFDLTHKQFLNTKVGGKSLAAYCQKAGRW